MSESNIVTVCLIVGMLGLFAVMGYGCVVVTESNERLRMSCIQGGGSVVPSSGGTFACIRGSESSVPQTEEEGSR